MANHSIACVLWTVKLTLAAAYCQGAVHCVCQSRYIGNRAEILSQISSRSQDVQEPVLLDSADPFEPGRPEACPLTVPACKVALHASLRLVHHRVWSTNKLGGPLVGPTFRQHQLTLHMFQDATRPVYLCRVRARQLRLPRDQNLGS